MADSARTDRSVSDTVDLYLNIERVALELSEALAEQEREPGTDVWRFFWGRLTESGPIPPRFPEPEDLQPIAEAWRDG